MLSLIGCGWQTASFEKLSRVCDTHNKDQRSEDRGQDDGAHFMAEVREECGEDDAEDGPRDPGVAHDQDLVKLASALICCRQAGQRQSRKAEPIAVNCDSFSRT